MATRFNSYRLGRRGLLWSATGVALILAMEPAQAQSQSPYVTVDLGAMPAGPAQVGTYTGPSGIPGPQLLMPPLEAPQSRLLVPMPETDFASVPAMTSDPVAAVEPMPDPAMTAPEPLPEPVIAAEPAPEPEPAVAALPEPVEPVAAEPAVPAAEIPETPFPEVEPVTAVPEQPAEPVAEPQPEATAVAEAPAEPEPAEEAPAAPEPTETAAVEVPAEEPAAEQPAAEEPAATQEAALPPADAPVEGQVRISFPEGASDIPQEAMAQLDELVNQLAADESSRIQLLAYASGTPDTASRARRVSLSRALAVRSYLIGKGIRSTRMDVRALGNTVPGDPADRVDIIPQ